MGLWQSKKYFLAGCYTQSTAQTGDWGTHLSFCIRKPLCLFWSFLLRGRLQVWHTSSGLQSFLSSSLVCGHHLGVLSVLCFSLPVSPRKTLICLASVFVFATQEHCQIVWKAGLILAVPQNYINLHAFKSCCLSGYWSESGHFYDNLSLSPSNDLYTQFLHGEHT